MTGSPQHIFQSSADRIKREMPAHFVLKDRLRKDTFLPRVLALKKQDARAIMMTTGRSQRNHACRRPFSS